MNKTNSNPSIHTPAKPRARQFQKNTTNVTSKPGAGSFDPLVKSASSEQISTRFAKNTDAKKNVNKNLMAPKLKRKVAAQATSGRLAGSSSDGQLNRGGMRTTNASEIEIYESINDLSDNSLASKRQRSNGSLASSTATTRSQGRKLEEMRRRSQASLYRSNQSLVSRTSKTSQKSNRALQEEDEREGERSYLNLNAFTSENISAENHKFIQEWLGQRRLYSGLQKTFLVLSALVTLGLLGLSIWMVIDQRFVFFANLSNKLTYSSFNRLIGLQSYVILTAAGCSFVLDLCQIFLFVYIKRFLDSHDVLELDRIIVNQIRLTKLVMLDEPVENENAKNLQIRGRTRDRLKSVKRSICAVSYMLAFFYVILFLAPLFFIGIFLHFKLDYILEYELPQTLLKLIKEYEIQQMGELVKYDSLVRMIKRNFKTNTVEEKLVDQMHLSFGCCNYLNPQRFGEMAPPSCNYERGCLKPTQEFLWAYLYFGILVLLTVGAFKFCLQLLLYSNYVCLLSSKLINKLYHVKATAYRAQLITQPENESLDQESKEEKLKRLQEIRRNKELLLEQEDAQEEQARHRQEQLAARLQEASRRQIEYERKLEREGRFEELEFERRQRQNEVAHLMSLHDSYEQLDH